MSASRMEAFTLQRFADDGWSGEGKPVAIVDGQVHHLQDGFGALRGSVARVVGVNDSMFAAVCEALDVESLEGHRPRTAAIPRSP